MCIERAKANNSQIRNMHRLIRGFSQLQIFRQDGSTGFPADIAGTRTNQYSCTSRQKHYS